jgi:hypothetical protein
LRASITLSASLSFSSSADMSRLHREWSNAYVPA